MADEEEADLIDEPVENLEPEEPNSPEPEDDGAEPSEEEGEAEEVIITLGDEEPPPSEKPKPAESSVIKGFRDREKAARAAEKAALQRTAELEAQLAAARPENKPGFVDKKPELSDKDIEFDQAKWEAATLAWAEREVARKAKAEAEKRQHEEAAAAWTKRVGEYQAAPIRAKLPNYKDAEETVSDALGETKLRALIELADKPAELVYALSRHPKELKALSEQKDFARYIKDLGRLEGSMSVQTTKAGPGPEKLPARGTAVGGGSTAQKNLDKLKEKARETSNWEPYFREKERLDALSKK